MMGDIGRQIDLKKEHAARKEQHLKGRQRLSLLCGHYHVPEICVAVIECQDLLNGEMKAGNLRTFRNGWEFTLAGMSQKPKEHILETLCRAQAKTQPGLKEQLSHQSH